MQKVIEFFNAINQKKVVFKPAIRIKQTPHSPIKWIDDIYQVKDQLMVSISTEKDNAKKLLTSCDDAEINSLTIRLYSLTKETV